MVSLSAYRKLHPPTGQIAGRSRSKKGKTKPTPSIPVGNGFLDFSFSPVAERQEELMNKIAVEKSFFDSLLNLSKLYEFQPFETKSKIYPYNLYLAFEHAKECINTLRPGLQLVFLQDETHPACIATVKRYDTGTTLFYIPVYPLLKENKKACGLLQSIFAYLLQVVKIPYFRDSSSFLFYNYETICEWVHDEPGEWSDTEFHEIVAEFKSLKRNGDTIYRRINSPYHLQDFEKRLKNFNPVNNGEYELLNIATKVFALMNDFPGRNIFENILPGLIDPGEEERISPEQYISFIWHDKGRIYEQLVEHVNACVQEFTAIDEPLVIQYFDHPQQKEIHDLRFETKLFDLLHDLCDHLNTSL